LSRSTPPPDREGPPPASSRERSPGGLGDLLPSRLEVDPTAYVAPSAVLLGHVRIGPQSSIWPTTVLRGDYSEIEIGSSTNLQDVAIVHGDDGFPCRLGDRVTVGHRAVVHASVVEDDCLVAMGAILLTGVRVGAGSFIGAGAVVPEGTTIPPGSLVLGVPGRIVRPVGEDLRERIRQSADNYVEYARAYREGRLG